MQLSKPGQPWAALQNRKEKLKLTTRQKILSGHGLVVKGYDASDIWNFPKLLEWNIDEMQFPIDQCLVVQN